MLNNDLIIESFSLTDKVLFQKRLKQINVPPDCEYLMKQTFLNSEDYSKRIFILLNNEKIGFLRKRTEQKLIGYCVVYKLETFNENSIMAFKTITQIPDSIIKNYPTVIADFLITGAYRRKGIGKYFASKIIWDFLKNEKISLMADGDGLKFWCKIGFSFANNSDKFMYLRQN